ncbi:MAG: hypothetical protein ACN2B6_04670 [Rickettsiales bacterium]
MGEELIIIPPKGEEDTEGAQRVFEQFLKLYQPTLIRVEYYLEDIIEHAGPAYAEAYQPWHDAVHSLFKGVYLQAKRIPLPDTEKFIAALETFSFDSAIKFLQDLCVSCKLKANREWVARFREHIKLLLFSMSILRRNQELALSH